MKQFLRVCWIIFCLIFSIAFLIAAFSQFISPAIFSYIVFFSIGFPYLYAALVVLTTISLFIHKKTALILAVLLLVGLYNLSQIIAVSPGSTWKPAKGKNAMRILTWNVASFVSSNPLSSRAGQKRKQMLQMISSYQPDILCLQEYSTLVDAPKMASVRDELDSLGYKYILQSNDKLESTNLTKTYKGVAICSKTPLTDTGRKSFQYDNRSESMLYADVFFQGRKVRIATAHLFSYFLFPDTASGYDGGERHMAKKLYLYKQNVQQRMRYTELEHVTEAKAINRMLDTSSYPVIYCGDMNSVPTSYTYRLLKDGRQDAFLKKGNGIGSTFYKMAPLLRIDVCFADTAFKVLQCKVVNKKLSDHYAVVTDVCWKH